MNGDIRELDVNSVYGRINICQLNRSAVSYQYSFFKDNTEKNLDWS